MKVSMKHCCVLVMLMAMSTSVLAADIYRTVDENGNVVYTDRPPTPDAKPITLRELSIVERPEYSAPTRTAPSEAEEADEMTMNQLRRRYREFRLVSPSPDQNFWGTSNIATLAWDAGASLMEGMSVVFYVDDQPSEPTRAATFTTPRLDRGEHVARADLVDAGNRVIASADPVVFHIKQQQRARARAVPAGGGGS